MTTRIASAQARAEWLQTGRHPRQRVAAKADDFAQQIGSAMTSQGYSQRSGEVATRQKADTTTRSGQDSGTDTRSNSTGFGFIVNYGSTAATSTPESAAAGETAVQTSPASAATEKSAAVTPAAASQDPISRLGDALKSVGLDPAAFGITAREDTVWYPGGTYMNRMLTVNLPNGRTENFDTNLTNLRPDVTVIEIQRLLNMTGPEFA
jgi:hypothetical protein